MPVDDRTGDLRREGLASQPLDRGWPARRRSGLRRRRAQRTSRTAARLGSHASRLACRASVREAGARGGNATAEAEAALNPALLSRRRLGSRLRKANTPGQDRTGDFQRVGLTSEPLDHRCLKGWLTLVTTGAKSRAFRPGAPRGPGARGSPAANSGYSSVGRASDCRDLQLSDGPWFDSGWPDFRFPKPRAIHFARRTPGSRGATTSAGPRGWRS